MEKEVDKVDLLLGKLLEVVEKTESFMTEQTPDFIKQMLDYDIWLLGNDILFWSFLLVFFLAIAILFLVLGIKKDDDLIGGFVFFLFMTILMGCGVYGTYCDMKKIEMAPKVYIIEKIKDLKDD